MRAFLLRHAESASNAAVDKVSLPEEEGDRLSPVSYTHLTLPTILRV